MGRGNDEHAVFWHAVGLTAEGAASEAIRELEPMQNNPEMALAVNAALINAHRGAKAKGQLRSYHTVAHGREKQLYTAILTSTCDVSSFRNDRLSARLCVPVFACLWRDQTRRVWRS